MKNLTVILFAAGITCCQPCNAQAQSDPIILEVTVRPDSDLVDFPPLQPLASQSRTRAGYNVMVPSSNWSASITTVNGEKTTGSFIDTVTGAFSGASAPSCCNAVSQVVASFETWTFDLRQVNGTAIGTIVANGTPGTQDFGITFGTGAYFGVRGIITREGGLPMELSGPGSNIRYPTQAFRLTLYPSTRPAIAQGPTGPAVVHGADATEVSGSFPAHTGEVLTVYARNLLPKALAMFAPLPVAATIGGIDAPILWSGRSENSTDGYQINLRVPPGLNAGQVDLQIASGYIPAPSVTIYVDGAVQQ